MAMVQMSNGLVIGRDGTVWWRQEMVGHWSGSNADGVFEFHARDGFMLRNNVRSAEKLSVLREQLRRAFLETERAMSK